MTVLVSDRAAACGMLTRPDRSWMLRAGVAGQASELSSFGWKGLAARSAHGVRPRGGLPRAPRALPSLVAQVLEPGEVHFDKHKGLLCSRYAPPLKPVPPCFFFFEVVILVQCRNVSPVTHRGVGFWLLRFLLSVSDAPARCPCPSPPPTPPRPRRPRSVPPHAPRPDRKNHLVCRSSFVSRENQQIIFSVWNKLLYFDIRKNLQILQISLENHWCRERVHWFYHIPKQVISHSFSV